jgi:hypothetical protein
MELGQFENSSTPEQFFSQESEASKSLQFQQLLKLMDREQALQIYETIKQLAAGEFKDSVMRDDNGELMIMWHGSPRKFDTFKTDATGEYRWRNEGVHFSSSREVIGQYADKAYSAIRAVLIGIARADSRLSADTSLEGEVLAEAKGTYNEIIKDLLTNDEDSQYYKKGYGYNAQQQRVRKKDLDSIVYKDEQFGIDWFAEIFNGQMPSKDNTELDQQNGILLGKGISRYEYAAVVNIKDPYTAEAIDMDQGFEAGENAHKEESKDGTILFHKEAVIGMGGLQVKGTENTYSAAVFDPSKIKILGRREGGWFVVINKLEEIEPVLEFSNVEITPEKPFEFSIHLEKIPINIKDGDALGANRTEVKFEGRLADLMATASRLQALPEKDKILKLVELVRANLSYPYSEIINGLKQTDPDLGQWLADRFGDDAKRINGVNLNDCLDRGYGNCKIMASTFLVLAQASGLRGMFAQNGEDKIKNLIRPDTGNSMFKMGQVGEPVNFSHAWAEVQLQDGSWIPVDLTANMAATTPELFELFKKANYKTQIPVIFDNMPNELDIKPSAVKFEPGQASGKFSMNIGIRRITSISRSGTTSRPVTDKYNGELKLNMVDSQENKAANLSIK